jgi:hypothetical protein
LQISGSVVTRWIELATQTVENNDPIFFPEVNKPAKKVLLFWQGQGNLWKQNPFRPTPMEITSGRSSSFFSHPKYP